MLLFPLEVIIIHYTFYLKTKHRFLYFRLRFWKSKERLRALPNPSRRNLQTEKNDLEESQPQEDTELTEEMDIEEEVKYFSIIT